MRGKADNTLLWIIVLLIGLVLLVLPKMPVSLSAVVMFGGGLALIAAWRTKGSVWPLVPGLFLLLLGGCRVLKDAFGFSVWIEGLFFIIPGLIGIIGYTSRHRRWLLWIGSFLLWIGAFLTLRHVNAPFLGEGALFCACVSGALFTISAVSRHKGITYVGGWVWAAIAALALLAKPIKFLLAAVLICVAITALVRIIAKRPIGGGRRNRFDAFNRDFDEDPFDRRNK